MTTRAAGTARRRAGPADVFGLPGLDRAPQLDRYRVEVFDDVGRQRCTRRLCPLPPATPDRVGDLALPAHQGTLDDRLEFVTAHLISSSVVVLVAPSMVASACTVSA